MFFEGNEIGISAYFYTSMGSHVCKIFNVQNLKEIHSATLPQVRLGTRAVLSLVHTL
jgi:hypothetical protein